LTCSAARTNIASVAPVWQAMLDRQPRANVFLTPLWQGTWWEVFGGDAGEECVLTLGGEHVPNGIAPLVRNGDTITFVGDTDLFDYHDFIVGDNNPASFFHDLDSCLASEAWSILDLRSVVEGSPTLEHLPELLRRRGCEVAIEDEDVVPGMPLPADFEQFVQSLGKHDRHELRRKLRRLGAAGAYRLVRATAETLDDDLTLFLDLMGESREEKRDFMVPRRERFVRLVMPRLLDAGILRLFFLDLDGERVAGVTCFDYAGRRLLYNSGYRLAHRDLSVGLMLKALTIRDAIESGLTYYDFLRGPEHYKYHLGGKDVRLHRIIARR